jgi:glycosyltransferase involved in cell wall biosynthesis
MDSKKLKVLFVLPTFSKKGAGVTEAPKGLALKLNENPKLEIHAIALEDELTHEDIDSWAPIRVHPVQGLIGGFVRRLDQLLKQIKPDVIHIHGLWVGLGIQAGHWAMKMKVPYILSPHGMMDAWAWKKSGIKKAIYYLLLQKRVLLNAKLLHALNQEEADSIQSIVPSQTLLIQPNGIDIDLFKRAQYDNAKRSRLLFLGRLDPKKSVLELIRVWKELVNEIPEFSWELEIAGSGHSKYEEQLKAEAGALLGEDIYFTGHVSGEKKVHCFENASAFILPSKSEGLPVAILEAWASALPVAMTEACNLSEALELKLAHKIDIEDAAFKDSLKAFLNLSQSELKSLGEQSHDYVKKYYSWNHIADAFYEVYKR